MLFKIKEYLQKQNVASNQQIARELCIDCDALEPMLELLIKKRIIRFAQPNSCKTKCTGCKKYPISIYEMIKV